jgi:hypothetical protein
VRLCFLIKYNATATIVRAATGPSTAPAIQALLEELSLLLIEPSLLFVEVGDDETTVDVVVVDVGVASVDALPSINVEPIIVFFTNQ